MFGHDYLIESLFYNEVKATSYIQLDVSKKWSMGKLQVPICKTNKQKPTTLAMACCQGWVGSTPMMVCAWELQLMPAAQERSRDLKRESDHILLSQEKSNIHNLGEWFLLKVRHLCISRKSLSWDSPMIQIYLKTAGICYGQKTKSKGQTWHLPASLPQLTHLLLPQLWQNGGITDIAFCPSSLVPCPSSTDYDSKAPPSPHPLHLQWPSQFITTILITED